MDRERRAGSRAVESRRDLVTQTKDISRFVLDFLKTRPPSLNLNRGTSPLLLRERHRRRPDRGDSKESIRKREISVIGLPKRSQACKWTSFLPPERIDSSGRAAAYAIVRAARAVGTTARMRPRPAERRRARPSAVGGGRTRERRRVCTKRAPVRRERSFFEKVKFFARGRGIAWPVCKCRV